MSVEIKGLEGLEKSINKLIPQMQAQLVMLQLKTAIDITRDAKLNCAVDSGRLRDSIMWKSQKKQSKMGKDASKSDTLKTRPSLGEWIVGTNVEYAALVEFGGDVVGTSPDDAPPPKKDKAAKRGTNPQAFLFPAWEKHMKKFRAAYRKIKLVKK